MADRNIVGVLNDSGFVDSLRSTCGAIYMYMLLRLLLIIGACEAFSLAVPHTTRTQAARSSMPAMISNEDRNAFCFGAGGGDGVKGVKTVSFQGLSSHAEARGKEDGAAGFRFGAGGGDGVKGVKTVSFQGLSSHAPSRD